MRSVRYEVWETFFRTWKEPIEMPDGSIDYPGDYLESNYRDASREQVIAWLKKNATKLAPPIPTGAAAMPH